MVRTYKMKKRVENQMTFKIQGSQILGHKQTFLEILRNYDKQAQYGNFNSSFFVPTQYNIFFNQSGQLTKDEELILDSKLEGVYILKPSLGEWGKGINMIHDMSKLEQDIEAKSLDEIPPNYNLKGVHILQKYVENPLTLEKKKIDLRTLFSIVSTDPLIVIHHHGYIRNSIVDFDLYEQTQFSHVINGYIQEQHQDYEKSHSNFKRYDFSQLKYHILEEYPQFSDFDIQIMEHKMLAGITYAIQAGKFNFECIKGDFEILAVDWVFDDNLQPYMVEINNCPFLTPQSYQELYYQVLPNIVADFITSGLQLNIMSRDEIIYRSQQDPEFVCQYAYRTKCQLLINEAVGFDYIQNIADIVEDWSPLNMQSTPRDEILNNL